MKTNMTIQEAIEYISSSNDDFAFRGDDFVPETTFLCSRYHGDNGDGEFALRGVSAIKVTANEDIYIRAAAEAAKKYGRHLFLLQGTAVNAHEWANDPGECLMQDHIIVGLIM